MTYEGRQHLQFLALVREKRLDQAANQLANAIYLATVLDGVPWLHMTEFRLADEADVQPQRVHAYLNRLAGESIIEMPSQGKYRISPHLLELAHERVQQEAARAPVMGAGA